MRPGPAQPERSAAPVEAPVAIENHPTLRVLRLQGTVGVAFARTLHACALELATPGPAVVVRAEHVRHLDCAAIQILLTLQAELQRIGVEFSCPALPSSVQDTLGHAGLGGVLAPLGVGE